MTDDFLNNLTSLTDNLNDIAFTRYATITKVNSDNTVDCRENNGTIHKNVINTTSLELSIDDLIILTFIDNDIYQPMVTGGVIIQKGKGTAGIVTEWETTLSDNKVPSEKLTKDTLDTKQDTLVSGTNIKTINNTSILGSGNIDIQGGGGSSVITVGSFRINNDGDLIVTLPNGTVNPYHINENGDLIYSTNPQIEVNNND